MDGRVGGRVNRTVAVVHRFFGMESLRKETTAVLKAPDFRCFLIAKQVLVHVFRGSTTTIRYRLLRVVPPDRRPPSAVYS